MTNRKHPLAKCEDCPLREGGQYVPSKGPESARIAVVGEAPNFADVRAGEPFQGPKGQLVRTVLDYHGVDPEEVFYTDSVACTPVGKEVPEAARSACRDRLLRELEDHAVERVVALGNGACQSVLNRSGVTKLRIGASKQSPYSDRYKVIPTLNPAACFRQGDQFPHLVADFRKVVTDAPSWIEPEYIVAYTRHDALAYIREVDRRLETGQGLVDNPERILVVDIECDIEKDIAFEHPNQYGMLCVGLGYDRRKVLVLAEDIMEDEQVLAALRELLLAHRLVPHNGKFDFAGLYPLIGGGLKTFFDTMLASYTLDERPGIHSLGYLAQELLGAPDWKAAIEKYNPKKNGYGAIPRDVLYRYNAFDLSCTYDLCYVLADRLDREDGGECSTGRTLRDVHDFLCAASDQLMYLELNGIAIDRDYLRPLDVQYQESLHRLEDELDGIVARHSSKAYDKAGGINPRSPLQVRRYLADKGIRVDSTDEATLSLILGRKTLPQDEEEVRDFCRTMLTHRREAKMHGTYVKGIAKRLYRGRVFPTFMLHGTVTGRLACRNPNLQNVPRESAIRRLYIPAKEENVFVSTDYSQAELRVLSYLGKDTYFRDIFNAGDVDVFDELTPILYPNARKDQMSKEEWKELRIRVKAYVYGLAYGRTEFSIAYEYNIPVGEASEGMKRFFDVIPDIVEFREQTRLSVLAGKDLVTPWGRHRRYPLITKHNVKDIMNEALAFIPQSTASDMTLMALTKVREETKGLAYIRNIVHDNLMLECHKDDVDEVVEITERRMLEAAKFIVGDYVKFAVDTTVGKNWGEL